MRKCYGVLLIEESCLGLRHAPFPSKVVSSRFMNLYSTATGQYQLGALSLKWNTIKRNTIGSSENRTVEEYDRYADFVMYDHFSKINIIVAEDEQDANTPIE